MNTVLRVYVCHYFGFNLSIRFFCFLNILWLFFRTATRLEESQMGPLFYLWVSLISCFSCDILLFGSFKSIIACLGRRYELCSPQLTLANDSKMMQILYHFNY